ncbi:Hydroxyacylglutathione hydrolase [Metallosphaera sp. J1]|uniref:MBL fold metallo-hydrolase n=1 Tax=Metallosphaera javensis (ex Hofmann et al. 2022) TaxID=99938 RepID=UPI001EDDA08F|nr:MBL fold metallo-hydrolase [Metallosphaera javensis (ex Hofmann et al. 2022)]MCG3110009.1 Hydroxyacylglutathione hydrolase [Metallosphaera javensis (ex Hofmann et al. 2022)]
MKLGKDTEVYPGSPNTLLYDGRIMIDQGGKNASLNLEVEVQLATHGHMDHIAGLLNSSKVRFLPPEDMWALSLLGRRAMTYGFSSGSSPLFTYDLVKVPISKDSISTSLPSEIQAIKLPGHTPGHTGYIVGSTLYAGDAFFGNRVLEGFVFPFYVDFWSAMESLSVVKELFKSVDNVVISHGPVYEKRKMEELLEFNIGYGEKLVGWVKDSISQGATAEEVVVRIMEKIGKGKEIKPTNVVLNTVTAKSILSQIAKEIRIEARGIVYFR